MKEGFWSKTNRPQPGGITSRWAAQFVAQLSRVEAKARKRGYKGSSKCRVCGQRNGSYEFDYRGWVWPEGLKHYIIEHNVKPSGRFIIFIGISSKN